MRSTNEGLQNDETGQRPVKTSGGGSVTDRPAADEGHIGGSAAGIKSNFAPVRRINLSAAREWPCMECAWVVHGLCTQESPLTFAAPRIPACLRRPRIAFRGYDPANRRDTMRVSERRYRPDIDGLRCVAIVDGGARRMPRFRRVRRRLRRRRRLLRDLGLPHHPDPLGLASTTIPARSITFYERRARRILPALTVAMARHARRGLRHPRPAAVRRAGAVGDRHGALRVEPLVLELEQRLFRRRRPGSAAAAHLVAGGRGAVLHPVSAAAGAGRPRRPAAGCCR